MPKVHLVTLPRLQRALGRVRIELEGGEFWDERMAEVDVYLVPAGTAYGWQHYGGDGSIHVPMVSLSKLGDWWSERYTSLADVLRHEYGHAFADTHRGLVRAKTFRDAFGASHEDGSEFEYDPNFHFTRYAATTASEDFAETFMFFLRHGGSLPSGHATTAKHSKWKFIRSLARVRR